MGKRWAVTFADDKAVVSSSGKGLQEEVDNINTVTKAFGHRVMSRA